MHANHKKRILFEVKLADIQSKSAQAHTILASMPPVALTPEEITTRYLEL